jgi:hypothetical protein
MRWVWLVGVILFSSATWSGEPLVSEVPDPEIAWIIDNSPVGVSMEDPNRLLFEELDLPLAIPAPALRGVDLGIDLDFGRRFLESPPQVDPVKPESLVGL